MNFDNEKYGVGIIFWDDRSGLIKTDVLSFTKKISVETAKAKAILEGLLLVKDM